MTRAEASTPVAIVRMVSSPRLKYPHMPRTLSSRRSVGAVIGSVLRHGRDNGKLAQVPKIELLKEADPRSGFVEQADFEAIAQHLAEDARLAATIGFEVAWRVKSEVLTLTWDRVDLAEGCIRLDESHSKNGKSRRVT